MKTVYSQKEFEQAILNHEAKILCKGEAANPFLRKHRAKRGAIAGGIAIAIAGIVAIPVTGGASAIATAGAIAGLTIGTVTISAAELAILCGAAVALTGILMGAKVKFITNPDGSVSVEVEPKYKEIGQ